MCHNLFRAIIIKVSFSKSRMRMAVKVAVLVESARGGCQATKPTHPACSSTESIIPPRGLHCATTLI